MVLYIVAFAQVHYFQFQLHFVFTSGGTYVYGSLQQQIPTYVNYQTRPVVSSQPRPSSSNTGTGQSSFANTSPFTGPSASKTCSSMDCRFRCAISTLTGKLSCQCPSGYVVADDGTSCRGKTSVLT